MSENNDNHVADQVEAYLDEELSPAERIAFDAHIAICESCRSMLEQSRQTRAELKSIFAGAHPSGTFEDRIIEGFRMRSSRRLFLIQPSVRRAAFAAAAAVLLTGAGVVVSQSLDVPNSRRTEMASDLQRIATALQNYSSDFGPHPSSDRLAFANVGPMASTPPTAPYSNGTADSKSGLALGVQAQAAFRNKADADGDGVADAKKLADVALMYKPANEPALPALNSPQRHELVGAGPDRQFSLGVDIVTDAAKKDQNSETVGKRVTGEILQGQHAADDRQVKEELRQSGEAGGKDAEVLAATQPAGLGRKIIRNANMEFEVERFDEALSRMTKLVTEQGGFVAGTDSDKLPNGKTRGTITLRVPPEHLDALVLELRGIGDLKSQKIGAEDITRHYTDLESGLRAAHAMEDRLLEIIKTGKGQIKDLLEAEKQLGVWREKIEQIEGEKRYLDNQVALSTLTVQLAERDIRQAAVATESEQVEMSLETEAVDKAYAKARELIESAKGRILQSEMKELDAGQFGATIRAAIPPDAAEQVIASLRQLNGRIAHFSRESHRTTQDGDASVAAANTVRHDDAIIAIQIYNLANIAPRRTTNILIAMPDVEKAYQQLLTDIQTAGGHVLSSSLAKPDANQQTGEIQVQLPSDKADSFELSTASLGETLRHESTENPDGANVTDAKRGFHFTIVSSTSIPARESRQLTLAAAAVNTAFDSVRQAVIEAGGRVTQSELNDLGADGQAAILAFDLPRAALPAVTSAIEKSATLLSQNATRSADTQNTIDSKLRFSLTINSAQRLSPREVVSLGSEVSDVSRTVAELTTAADAAGGRRVDSGGISQDRTGATTADVIVELPADKLQMILDQLEHGGRIFNKQVTFDAKAPQGPLSRARIQATFSDSDKSLGGQESGWDALRHGLETSAAGLRWSLQMLVIGACFVAPWALVIWIAWKLLRRKPRQPAAV